MQRRQVAIEAFEPKAYLERFAVLLSEEVGEYREPVDRTSGFRVVLYTADW